MNWIKLGATDQEVEGEALDLGQPFEEVLTTMGAGSWAAIQIDEDAGKLIGVTDDRLDSLVEGF